MSNTATTDKAINGEELDRRFDSGEDVLQYLDTEHPVVEHHASLAKRITLTMPAWMVAGLDEEANELAVSRNAVVNTWLAERLRSEEHHNSVDA